MTFAPPSPEEEKRRREALEQHPTIAAAARALGIPRETLSSWAIKARARGDIPDKISDDHYSVKGESILYDGDGAVKARWLKTERSKPSPEEIGRQIRQALDDYKSPTSFPTLLGETDDDLATRGLSVTLDASDVAVMMLDMKLARLEGDPLHMDSWVDVCGYGACGGSVAKDKISASWVAK